MSQVNSWVFYQYGHQVTNCFKNVLPDIVSVWTKHSLRKAISRDLCLIWVHIGIFPEPRSVEIPPSRDASHKILSVWSGYKLHKGNKFIRTFKILFQKHFILFWLNVEFPRPRIEHAPHMYHSSNPSRCNDNTRFILNLLYYKRTPLLVLWTYWKITAFKASVTKNHHLSSLKASISCFFPSISHTFMLICISSNFLLKTGYFKYTTATESFLPPECCCCFFAYSVTCLILQSLFPQ